MKRFAADLIGRVVLACTCAVGMYLCAAGYGIYMVYRHSPAPKTLLGVILFVPACASLMFLAAGAAIPGLLAPKRLTFPLNVTLPPVYASFLLLTVILFTSTGSSLVVPYEKVRAAMFWANPWVLILVTLAQILLLTVGSMFTRAQEE